MALTELQQGRIAAAIAELGENPDEALLREAAGEIQKQLPALHQIVFHQGWQRGEERAAKKHAADLAALKGTTLPADREVALRTELDQLRAQVDLERRGRVEAELVRATEGMGLNSTWVSNELNAAWRTGTLSFDASGQVEAQGVAPAPGESALAAYARVLKGRCPPELVKSNGDRGSDTGQDRGGASGSTLAQRLVPEFQRQRDARVNPLAPTAPANPLATGPAYSSPADALLKVGMQRLVAQAVEAGRSTLAKE